MTSTSTQSPSSQSHDVIEMVSCEDCGHMVPEMNLAIHRAHACKGRARPTSSPPPAAATGHHNNNINNNDSSPQSVVDLSSPVRNSGTSSTNNSNNINNNTRKRNDNTTTSRKRRTGKLKRGDDDDDSDNDEDYLPLQDSNSNGNNDNSDEEEDHDDPMDVDVDVDEDVDPALVEHIQGQIQQQQQLQNIPAAAAATSNSEVVNLLDDDDKEDEWACPRCTLLNAPRVRLCEACNHLKDGAGKNASNNNSSASSVNIDDDDDDDDIQVEQVRAADPVRRERLIGGDDDYDDYYSNSLGMVGGGALLGGFVGAANAYMRGRPMGSGSLEGAMGGALAGGLANEFFRPSPDRSHARRNVNRNSYRRHQQRQQRQDRQGENDGDSPLSHARSAGANGQPAYPVMNAVGRRHSTQQPRSSFRVVQSTNNGYTTTVVQSSGREGSTRFVQRNTGGSAGRQTERDPMLSFMLHSMLAEGGPMPPGFLPMRGGRFHNQPNIDGMSYEQLLAAFGDGTENLRASEEIISSLPTHKVTLKPGTGEVDLPKDAQQCSICLEDFEGGQTRKTLPCLHGMHEDCIDKWLRTNAACPVCKYSVKPQQHDHDAGTGDGSGM